MKKRIKNVMVTTGVCVSLLAFPVSAAEQQSCPATKIQLMSLDTQSGSSMLGISRGKATCVARSKCKNSKTMKITMSLQKYSSGKWKSVRSWSGSKTGISYVFNKTAKVSNGSYRVKAVIKIGNDTITKYSTIVKY